MKNALRNKITEGGKCIPRYHLSLPFSHKNGLVGYGELTRYPSAVTGVPDVLYLRFAAFKRTARGMYSLGIFLLPRTVRQLSEGNIQNYLFPVIAFIVVIVALKCMLVNSGLS